MKIILSSQIDHLSFKNELCSTWVVHATRNTIAQLLITICIGCCKQITLNSLNFLSATNTNNLKKSKFYVIIGVIC
jgi:hypothetical protein